MFYITTDHGNKIAVYDFHPRNQETVLLLHLSLIHIWVQASVETVKPYGTGMPRLVISARFAPLPPRSSRMEPLPSLKR